MRRKRPSRLRDDLSRKGIKHKKNIREGSGARAPGPFFVNKTFSVIFSGGGGIIIAASAIRTDRSVRPALRGIIPAAHGLRSKCRFAALPSLRTWYNNCGRHSSDRLVGPPRFCGDYLHIMKGMVDLSRLHGYILKRYLLLLVGLSVMAFGVAFSIKASLGTSPISSVPYVVSLFTPLTVGTATIVMHCVFIALQILILRKNYHPIQLMQLPVAFFFGYLTDFGVWGGSVGSHIMRTGSSGASALIGIFLVAVGSKPGSESGRRSARRRGRSSCDLPGAPGLNSDI